MRTYIVQFATPGSSPHTYETECWEDAIEAFLGDHPEIPAFPRIRRDRVVTRPTDEDIEAYREAHAAWKRGGKEARLRPGDPRPPNSRPVPAEASPYIHADRLADDLDLTDPWLRSVEVGFALEADEIARVVASGRPWHIVSAGYEGVAVEFTDPAPHPPKSGAPTHVVYDVPEPQPPVDRESYREVPVESLAQLCGCRWTTDKTAQIVTLPLDEPVELLLTPVR